MSPAVLSPTDGDSNLDRCYKCTNEDSNPRLLHCFHSFCLGCLQSLSQRHGDTIECPDCVEQTILDGNFDQLPLSTIFGKRILDINKFLRRSTESEPCAGCPPLLPGCPERGPDNKVCAYCLDCQEFFCNSCAGKHTSFRFASTHRLLTGNNSEVKKPRDLVRETSRFCGVHLGEEEKLYCRECDECICELCYSRNHERCEQVELVDKIKEEMKDFTENKIELLRKRIDRGKKYVKNLERQERQIIRRTNEVERDLEARARAANEWVSHLAEDFHFQLANQASQRSEIFDNAQRAASQQVEDLEIFRTTISRCLEKAASAHIVTINSQGHLEKLESEATDFFEDWHTKSLEFYESMRLEELLGDTSVREVLGRLEETESDDDCLDDEDFSGSELNDAMDKGLEGNGAIGEILEQKELTNEYLEDENLTGSKLNDDHNTDKVRANEIIENETIPESESSGGRVEMDNGQVKVNTDDSKTKDKENDQDKNRKGEITDKKTASEIDHVGVVGEKTENRSTTEERVILWSNSSEMKTAERSESSVNQSARPMSGELHRTELRPDSGRKLKRLLEKKGKRTIVTATNDERFEFTTEHSDFPDQMVPHQMVPHQLVPHQMVPHQMVPHQMVPHQMVPHQMVPHQMVPHQMVPHQVVPHQMVPHQMVPHQMAPHQMVDCLNVDAKQAANEVTVHGSHSRRVNETDICSRDNPLEIFFAVQKQGTWSPVSTVDGQRVPSSGGRDTGAFGGVQDFRTAIHQSGVGQRASCVATASKTLLTTPLINTNSLSGGMSQGRAEQMTTGSPGFSTSSLPITTCQNGKGQDLTRTYLMDIDSYPIGSSQNGSRSETTEPEVLFFHEVDTYRGTQRVGSGVIKVVIDKEDYMNTAEMFLEWDEEFNHLTPDSPLELLALDPERNMIQLSGHAESGRGASAVQFEEAEDAEKFENMVDQLIGQMSSLRIANIVKL